MIPCPLVPLLTLTPTSLPQSLPQTSDAEQRKIVISPVANSSIMLTSFDLPFSVSFSSASQQLASQQTTIDSTSDR